MTGPTKPNPTGAPGPLPAHEAAERRDWAAYFERMEGKPPRGSLLNALDRFGPIDPSDAPLAVDLGCGSGQDAVAVLERGWRLWATDANAEGLRRLCERPVCAQAIAQGRLSVHLSEFEAVCVPAATLVNASFSLPFCPPHAFPVLWAKIDAALTAGGPGGRFSGQFFGDRDDWAILEDRTHLTRAETIALFDQYILEHFEEEDRPSKQAGDAHKHWHVFHVVARKR
jgi:SAM-dependent methyltransferase